MREDTAVVGPASKVVWTNLEEFTRGRVQEFIQAVLEEEVTALLGRGKSERREACDAPAGYRNGHGKTRRLCLTSGTIEIQRPRVRDLEERFESRVLPLFKRRTQEVAALLPELYLHGLSQGDFDLALRGLLGDGAPLSASSIARLKEDWQREYEVWRSQSLGDIEVVYLWVDGLYVKAGLEKGKAALLVVVAALRDGSKRVVALQSGQRESTESWSAILRDLKRRGMNCPRLVIGDGHLGIWGALANVFPEADEQRCWNHRVLNVLDRINKRAQLQARQRLLNIPYAPTLAIAERRKEEFQQWCREEGFAAAGELLNQDWERMVTFYRYPAEHWLHLRTTNVVESPFAAVRLRTNAAKRYQKVENATAMIWRLLRVAEKGFRRLNAPEQAALVAMGAEFQDGILVNRNCEKAAA